LVAGVAIEGPRFLLGRGVYAWQALFKRRRLPVGSPDNGVIVDVGNAEKARQRFRYVRLATTGSANDANAPAWLEMDVNRR
jgi:hypothetical protein